MFPFADLSTNTVKCNTLLFALMFKKNLSLLHTFHSLNHFNVCMPILNKNKHKQSPVKSAANMRRRTDSDF